MCGEKLASQPYGSEFSPNAFYHGQMSFGIYKVLREDLLDFVCACLCVCLTISLSSSFCHIREAKRYTVISDIAMLLLTRTCLIHFQTGEQATQSLLTRGMQR